MSSGPSGLVVRLVFVGDENLSALERELSNWQDEHIVATGDNVHARRIIDMKSESLPCIKLYSPDDELRKVICGFDTELGLDSLTKILSAETGKKAPKRQLIQSD